MASFLPFVQLDLPGRIALDEGRYLARSEDSEGDDVLVIRILGAQRAKKRLRRGKPVPIEAAEADPLSLTRLTVVKARPFEDESAAEAWLAAVSSDSERQEALADETVRLINRAIHAHAVATNYPYAGDLDGRMATVIRFGYGLGQEVAEGQWTAARELAEGAQTRLFGRKSLDSVGAQERVAAVLGRRDSIAAAETLLLRARADIEQQRWSAAALGAEAGLSAAGETKDPEQLANLREEAKELARVARSNRLGPDDETRLRKLVGAATRLLGSRR